MKKIIIDNRVYGPYILIEVLSDRYRCDSADLPFSVVGQGIISDVIDGDFPPIVAPTVVPTEIHMAQCRAQLIIDGKDDDVELLLSGITDTIQQKLYRAYFEYEPIVKRSNPMINEMAPTLGIDLDAFFINASKL